MVSCSVMRMSCCRRMSYKACALLQQLLPLVRQIYGKAK